MGRAKTGSNFTSSKERERREERLEPKERERRKDCYQSPLLYDGGARAEGEREEGGGSFLLGGQTDGRRLRLKPIKWQVERERGNAD